MLEGHTFRALLDSSLKLNPVYHYHELIHNLPGPAFLFASGAAFSLATLPHWDQYRRWSGKLGQRLLRFLALLAVGYMLHLTYFSFRRTLAEGTADQWTYLFSMDILQCIAAASLFLQLLVIVLPGREWYFRTAVLLSAAIGLATPVVWLVSKNFPWWLGTHWSGHWASAFPLFPYAGFHLAGAAWGYLHVQSRQQEAEDHFLRRSQKWSARLIFASLAATPAIFLLPEAYTDFWTTGPTFFFLRVGVLGWLLVGFRRAESHLVPALRTVVLLGRGSLLVYVSHLILLHGSALNPDRNLLKLLGNSRPALDAALVLLLLTGAMALLCWGWNRLQENYRWPAVGARWSLAGYLVYVFLSG